ncbi:MAG: TolC family protein [Deltaproteobacteria bacterium]|nr:TolC family protein [Deltaproteobacteria bacterium]
MPTKTILIFINVALMAVFTCDIAWTDEGLNISQSIIIQDEAIRKTVGIKEPEGSITLTDALAHALVNNPELAAFSLEKRAADARVIQSRLIPNPEISAVVENIGGAKEVTGGVQTTIQLSQLIELGGKRSARTRTAYLSQDLAEKDYEKKRIEVLSEVSMAFIKTLSAQRHLALAEEMAGLARQVVKTVSERVMAGKVSPVEETKAGIALSSVMVEQERAKLELASSRNRLSSMWGSVSPRFETAVGDMEDQIAPVPPIEQLTARLSNNPDVVRSEAEISQRKAVIDLERSKVVQDISVNAGYRRFTDYDENSVIVGVTIPLPIFNRNQGGVLESRLLLSKAEEERRAAEVKAATLLAEAFKSISIAYVEVTTLRENMLPGAQSSYDATMEGYRMGKFGYLDVLDAQRTLFDVRLHYIKALTGYHLAVADVEQLIGETVITKRTNIEQQQKEKTR